MPALGWGRCGSRRSRRFPAAPSERRSNKPSPRPAEDGLAAQKSAVDKAERSSAPNQEAATKLTEDGYVVESFRSLLAMLATIVKNWLRPHGVSTDPFTLTTKPNEHQLRALTLLDVAIGA